MLGDGKDFGVNLSYALQPSPDGLAQAFIIGEEFIGNDSVCLALGDNIFWGHGFSPILKRAASRVTGATVFGYQVKDPERFGVVAFDDKTILHIRPSGNAPELRCYVEAQSEHQVYELLSNTLDKLAKCI